MMSKFVQVFVILHFITITSSNKSSQTLTKLNFLHLFSPDIVLEEPEDILEKAVQWLNEQCSSKVDITFTVESFMVHLLHTMIFYYSISGSFYFEFNNTCG